MLNPIELVVKCNKFNLGADAMSPNTYVVNKEFDDDQHVETRVPRRRTRGCGV